MTKYEVVFHYAFDILYVTNCYILNTAYKMYYIPYVHVIVHRDKFPNNKTK
jgi:hypothetical protein